MARPQLGKYSLVAEIARGGMGIVYLARMSGPAGFEKLAVVKQLKPELAEDDKFLGMFMDEARLAAKLNHRNIVQTNEVGEHDGIYYMAMEYLEGKTLSSVRSRLKGEKAKLLPTPMMLRVACEVLAGLHYAHELTSFDGSPLGIVHRDVSTQNVFLTYDGQVKVLDFGVAKALGREQETEVGMLKGRVVCMSPEQVANESIDRRADIFSMGVLLRESVTNQKIWDKLQEIDVIKNLLARKIPAFPDDAGVPDDLRAIIEKAMAPSREDRYATADDMRAALEIYLAKTDPGGSLSKLGAVVAKEFAEHRTKVRALIEQHVAGSAEIMPSTDLPLLPHSSPDLGGDTSSRSLPSALSAANSRPKSGTSLNTAGELPPQAASIAPLAPGKRSSSATIIAAAIAVVGLIIGGAIIFTKSGNHPIAAAPQTPASTPAPAIGTGGTPPPQSDIVELTIRATPANAQIFIDDALMSENPFRAKYPRGGSHSIRVVAPNHAPKSETITLSESTNVSVSLDRAGTTAAQAAPTPIVITRVVTATPTPKTIETASAPKAAEPKPSSPPPTTPEGFTPGAGKAPQRNIDPKNPYNQ